MQFNSSHNGVIKEAENFYNQYFDKIKESF
jgi:hypothetical protein